MRAFMAAAAVKETVMCCISCFLPCGALDVIRIVHMNGRVEEISRRTISAAEIMEAYPKHVLRKPAPLATESRVEAGVGDHATVVVPPSAELKRGNIYFLMPAPPPPPPRRKKKKKMKDEDEVRRSAAEAAALVISADTYLKEILSESKAAAEGRGGDRRRRRRGGVWRPHLESIYEAP